nr:probable serine/threonine-protein kinase WNK11 [Tanacetum cinerariifolium]
MEQLRVMDMAFFAEDVDLLAWLGYMHTHELCVIHRDLSCSNIFINGNIGKVVEGHGAAGMIFLGSLRDYRKKHKHVSLKGVETDFQRLGYMHTHELCVIHRDLSCSNIFINGNIGKVAYVKTLNHTQVRGGRDGTNCRSNEGKKKEDPHLDVRPTLQRFPFYCTPLVVADAGISNPTLEDLVVGTPSSKILTKAEASQNTTRPSLFVGDSDDESDGDDDSCVEIPLVTLLRSTAVILSLGNQGRSSTSLATEDSQSKGIIVDDVAAPSVGASRSRPSFRPTPSFRDVSGDAIHADFFPFFAGSYYAIYPPDGFAGNCEFTRKEWDTLYHPTFGVLTKEVFKDPSVCKTVVDQFLTSGEMVLVEALSKDQLPAKADRL